MNKRTGPVQFGAGLQKVLKKMDRSGGLPKAEVISVWRNVVGGRIADHTYVVGVRKKELLIATDSAAWANELSYMTENLKQQLNKEIGKDLVGSIRFTVSQEVLRDHEAQAASRDTSRGYGGDKVAPEPLSVEELAIVQRSVSVIQDEALREAALRATVRGLEWKKGQEGPKPPEKPPGDV